MKIKEVIEKTGLTDRAIRLYITNGLVAPENQKSYTGRNSYDFTEEDVTNLRQIALLRKADFSLEQIKALRTGGEEAAEVFRNYLADRREECNKYKKILNAFQNIPQDETPSIAELCSRLEDGFGAHPVPAEDTAVSLRERICLWILWGAIAGIFGWMLLSVVMETAGRFPFCRTSWEYINVMNGAAMVILLIPSAILLSTLVSMIRRGTYNGLAIIAALLTSVVFVPPAVTILLVLPPVYSQTDDPHHYLQVGDDVRDFMEDVYLIFPAQIPDSAAAQSAHRLAPAVYADTTVYHYWYSYGFSPDLDIIAQWNLPEDALHWERERILGLDKQYEIHTEYKGDWECFTISIEDNPLQTDRCSFELIFACNEKTGTVRYIAYVNVSGDGERWREGYYENLDW